MYKLCYVDDGVMYFTDNFEQIVGDDWDDKPYEHNAGEPYELSKDEPLRDGYGHIRYLAFKKEWGIKEPCGGFLNSPYSVNDINNGAVAWLFTREAGGLMAGATIEEAIEWCKKANIKCGELK